MSGQPQGSRQVASDPSYTSSGYPEAPVVNQLFGVGTGLGMSGLTFDWSQIAYIGTPLNVPWWAVVNIFTGFVVMYWIFTPAMYYTNVSFPTAANSLPELRTH